MKTLRMIAAVTAFSILPISEDLCAQETASQAPPIEQALVREGDFAVKLVERLRIGTPQNEAEAETMLSSKGISPKNGWISDYPVTPDIIGELQNTVGEAADAGRLSMRREEALRVFQNLAVEVGLNVVAESQTEYPSERPPKAYSYYSEPTVVNYFYTYGPPIVTYYPPPGPYLYLYAWIPYPFCWTGWYFPGFYVLHNFHRWVCFHHPHHYHQQHHRHHHVYVSNHWRDTKTGRVFVIDPSKRQKGQFIRSRDPSSSRSSEMIERQSPNRRPRDPSSYGGKPPQVRDPVGNQKTSRPPAEAGSRERVSEVSIRFWGMDRPNGAIYPGVRTDKSSSYDRPRGSFSRSFNPPSYGGVKSFTPSNLGNRGSFGTTHRSTGGFGFSRSGR